MFIAASFLNADNNLNAQLVNRYIITYSYNETDITQQ